jgi:hypothetical protein
MLVLLGGTANAVEYNPFLLRVQASIFPKIILLDKQLGDKMINSEIVINIVAIKEDMEIAEVLRKAINEKHKNTLGDKKFRVVITEFNDFDRKATAFILLQGSKDLYEPVVEHAANRGLIVFSHNYLELSNNALISLFVKEKTYVYLNKSVTQLYDVKFSPIFYKIVTILE